jgi:hypothetical protein
MSTKFLCEKFSFCKEVFRLCENGFFRAHPAFDDTQQGARGNLPADI